MDFYVFNVLNFDFLVHIKLSAVYIIVFIEKQKTEVGLRRL